MNDLSTILIFLILTLVEVASLLRKKEKKHIIVFIIVMIIPLILSIKVVTGVNTSSISSITGKLFLPIIKKLQVI
jgi:uncharacterized membrane protein